VPLTNIIDYKGIRAFI